jgi:hypothetical protein
MHDTSAEGIKDNSIDDVIFGAAIPQHDLGPGHPAVAHCGLRHHEFLACPRVCVKLRVHDGDRFAYKKMNRSE